MRLIRSAQFASAYSLRFPSISRVRIEDKDWISCLDNEELKKQLAFAVQLFPGDPAAENGAQGADPGAQAQGTDPGAQQQGGQAQQNS